QGASRFRPGLGPLRVLDGVSTGTLAVKEAKQAGQVDGLPRGVEDVAGAGGSQAHTQGTSRAVQVDHADGQAAVQRHPIARLDRQGNGNQTAFSGGLEKILRGRLAAPRGFETALAQQLPDGFANRVIASKWSSGFQIEPS